MPPLVECAAQYAPEKKHGSFYCYYRIFFRLLWHAELSHPNRKHFLVIQHTNYLVEDTEELFAL